MTKTYKSDVASAMHEMMSDFHEAGAIPKSTMRKFDKMCLMPVEKLAPEEIKAIRVQENASQAVFARHLLVSTSIVSKWERGVRSPDGPALKLLTVVKNKGLECIS